MSEVVSMINNMKTPGSQPREKPKRRKKRVLVFDRVLEYSELLEALQIGGFEIVPKTTLASASAAGTPELILAEIHELELQDRRAIESLRQSHPQLVVIGIGRPVVVALARGRRRAQNYPERRRNSRNRRVFDEFVSLPIDVPALLDLIKTQRSLARLNAVDRPKSD
jgi:hypothetical protein